MRTITERGSFIGQLLADRVAWAFFILFAVCHIPYFLPLVSESQFSNYEWGLWSFLFLPYLAAVLWPTRGRKLSANERGFWRLLSTAIMLWWVVSLFTLLWPAEARASLFGVSMDFLYLGYYLCWVMALSYVPQHARHQEHERPHRWLSWAALLVLSLSLFLYFVLIPNQYSSDNYQTWVPSMVFYTFMDILLAALVLVSAIRSRPHRWRVLYATLLVNLVLFALLDIMEALSYMERLAWVDQHRWFYGVWNLPLLGMVIWGRAGQYDLGTPASAGKGKRRADKRPAPLTSPIILVSFVMPVLHIVLEQTGSPVETVATLRSAVVLASLAVFWALAFTENRWLRKLNSLASAYAAENERLRVSQQVAEASERVKAHFLANVSHEIRTPMNGILGMSEIMLRDDLGPARRSQVELIRSSAQGLLVVMDDILLYSKLDAEKVSFLREPFKLRELVTQVLDLFRVTWEKKGLGIQTEFSDEIPATLVGDPSRLRQILINLVGNAFKFTPQGTIRLAFSCAEAGNSKILLRAEVTDTGIGIEKEHLARLFLPFSQVDESHSRAYSGNGLGLAISKKIVEAQGGVIGVDSSPGNGSTFWFELPFEAGGALAEDDPAPGARAIPNGYGKILLAEDNEINQIVALQQIEALGARADVVNNGEEALEAIAKGGYSLVLMDCQMPKLDGIEATRRLREKGYSAHDLPIVALTAHAFEEDRQRCLEAGMNDFLSKPLSLDDLRETLTRWLP